MNDAEPSPLRAFISYTHDYDTPEHRPRVLRLAQRLRSDGIAVEIDQYHEQSPPSVGWPGWMRDQIEAADFVLVVCTPTYYRRFLGKEEPGKGKGARWEGALITQQIYEDCAENTRFIPAGFASFAENAVNIPDPLRATTYRDLSTEEGYSDLLRHLTRQPRVIPAPVGKIPNLPPEDDGSLSIPAEAPIPQEASSLDHPVAEHVLEGSDHTSASVLPYVPHEKNEFFTGRKQILQDARSALVKNGIAVLYGLGGIGKTQTAVEYAYEHADEYTNVFWTGAETDLELSAGYREIARYLNLPVKDLQNLDDIVRAVKYHLETNGGWLLILDNAGRQEVIKPLLPRKGYGHVLLTSRSSAFDALFVTNPIEITEMVPSEARNFLHRRTGRDQENTAEAEAAATLAEELDYLPLALEQAGAYIYANRTPFQRYLAGYRNRHLQLLEQAKPVTGDYKASVRTTWALNFEEVKAASEASADLLRLSAFLGSDDIPQELFLKGAGAIGPALASALAGIEDDELVLDDVLRPLLRYSLVRRDSVSGGYSIHRLVQAVLRDDMAENEQCGWAERAVGALDRTFPEPEFADWPLYDRLLPHIQACAAFIESLGIQNAEAGRLLDHAGWYLMERARYSEVEPLLQLSRLIRENVLGTNHPDVAKTLNNLGVLREFQGRYVEAENLFVHALQIREHMLETDDPYLALSLNRLGSVYLKQKRYSEAEVLIKRALVIREKTLGKAHPDVAKSLGKLGIVYLDQNLYSEAEESFRRTLDIQVKSLGAEHPYVAASLHNLGMVYHSQKRYSEAEVLIKRALDMQIKGY
jgi:tetratricopeptide (TPR) repeat protein